MPKDDNSGFIHFIPVLIIAVAILAVSFSDFSNFNLGLNRDQSVLSETTEESKSQDEEDNQIETQTEERSEDGNLEGERETNRVETRTQTRQEESDDEDDKEEDLDDSDENETESEDEVKIEDEDGSPLKIKIKSKSGGKEFEFESEGISAQSNFPLSVNPETNELIVTTPNGEKVVTILPDQAISNMLENGKITSVLSSQIEEGENGQLEYQVEGEDQEKLLGIFKVKIHKRLIVSAQTGEEISSQLDFLNKLLDALSF